MNIDESVEYSTDNITTVESTVEYSTDNITTVESTVEYSTDNITTVETIIVKEEVKEQHAETVDPLHVTIQPGN